MYTAETKSSIRSPIVYQHASTIWPTSSPDDMTMRTLGPWAISQYRCNGTWLEGINRRLRVAAGVGGVVLAVVFTMSRLHANRSDIKLAIFGRTPISQYAGAPEGKLIEGCYDLCEPIMPMVVYENPAVTLYNRFFGISNTVSVGDRWALRLAGVVHWGFPGLVAASALWGYVMAGETKEVRLILNAERQGSGAETSDGSEQHGCENENKEDSHGEVGAPGEEPASEHGEEEGIKLKPIVFIAGVAAVCVCQGLGKSAEDTIKAVGGTWLTMMALAKLGGGEDTDGSGADDEGPPPSEQLSHDEYLEVRGWEPDDQISMQ